VAGQGSWLKVWDLNRQVEEQQQFNRQNQARNALLDAEVRDLKEAPTRSRSAHAASLA